MKWRQSSVFTVVLFILFFAFPVSALGIDPVSPSEQELLASFSESNQGTLSSVHAAYGVPQPYAAGEPEIDYTKAVKTHIFTPAELAGHLQQGTLAQAVEDDDTPGYILPLEETEDYWAWNTYRAFDGEYQAWGTSCETKVRNPVGFAFHPEEIAALQSQYQLEGADIAAVLTVFETDLNLLYFYQDGQDVFIPYTSEESRVQTLAHGEPAAANQVLGVMQDYLAWEQQASNQQGAIGSYSAPAPPSFPWIWLWVPAGILLLAGGSLLAVRLCRNRTPK